MSQRVKSNISEVVLLKIDRSIIGYKMKPYFCDIEKGAIRKFAEAIGDDNAIYHDESVAKARGYRSLVAPLTFPTSFRPKQEAEWFTSIDRKTLLYAEQEFQYKQRLVAGQRIKCIETVKDVYSKTGKSSDLTFIIKDKEGYDENNRLLFIERQTFVIKGGD